MHSLEVFPFKSWKILSEFFTNNWDWKSLLIVFVLLSSEWSSYHEETDCNNHYQNVLTRKGSSQPPGVNRVNKQVFIRDLNIINTLILIAKSYTRSDKLERKYTLNWKYCCKWLIWCRNVWKLRAKSPDWQTWQNISISS